MQFGHACTHFIEIYYEKMPFLPVFDEELRDFLKIKIDIHPATKKNKKKSNQGTSRCTTTSRSTMCIYYVHIFYETIVPDLYDISLQFLDKSLCQNFRL